MFGDVVFSHEDEGYTEYRIADEQGIQVTACFMSGTMKLFRIEWTEQDGYQANKAVYSLLEAIQTDQDAYAFIDIYLSKELRPQLVKIYSSDRHEMNRTPRQAIDNLLSLPPL